MRYSWLASDKCFDDDVLDFGFARVDFVISLDAFDLTDVFPDLRHAFFMARTASF